MAPGNAFDPAADASRLTKSTSREAFLSRVLPGDHHLNASVFDVARLSFPRQSTTRRVSEGPSQDKDSHPPVFAGRVMPLATVPVNTREIQGNWLSELEKSGPVGDTPSALGVSAFGPEYIFRTEPT